MIRPNLEGVRPDVVEYIESLEDAITPAIVGKNCLTCGRPFFSQRSAFRKFCSKDCADIHRPVFESRKKRSKRISMLGEPELTGTGVRVFDISYDGTEALNAMMEGQANG